MLKNRLFKFGKLPKKVASKYFAAFFGETKS
jgi:hypothetical protein